MNTTLTHNPEAEKHAWKEKFIERYRTLTNIEAFQTYSTSYPTRAIRVNTLKTTIEDIKKRLKDWQLKQVPWCKEGFWINHTSGRRDIGNTIEHALGHIYVQEPASMIPPIVLDPQPGERVLDMCAAPGSKTSEIAALMHNTGIIIANDIKGDRLSSLGINLQRLGVSNTIITQMRGQQFKHQEFDRILVDAPCSGTGTIRKSLATLNMWNPIMIKRLHGTQKQLLETAWTLIKPGGIVVYSTCTMEPEENEGTVSYLLNKHADAHLEDIQLDIKRSTPITNFEGKTFHPDVTKCLRIWPQDNNTEGFFVAKFKKTTNHDSTQ